MSAFDMLSPEDTVDVFTKHANVPKACCSVPFIIFGLFWAFDALDFKLGMLIAMIAAFVMGAYMLIVLAVSIHQSIDWGYWYVPFMDIVATVMMIVFGIMLATRLSDAEGVRADAFMPFATTMAIYLAVDSVVHLIYNILKKAYLQDEVALGEWIGSVALAVLYILVVISVFTTGLFDVAQVAFFVYVVGMLVGGAGNFVSGVAGQIQFARSGN